MLLRVAIKNAWVYVKNACIVAWNKTVDGTSWVVDRLPRSLELAGEHKAVIWESIKNDSEYGRIYWLQMGLSSVIAALGLLQNSTAVVIGAMLVAPLLRPMQGVAYGIATAQTRFFIKNLRILFYSVVLGIGVGFIVLVVSPITFTTPEILARVSPNFLDLLIAVASAAIAFLALSFKSLSASIAGVAMAASLVPPLAVAGISIGLQNVRDAWGSFFLFATNMLAILLVGVLIFFLFGYRPHQDEAKETTAKQVVILLLLLAIISVPLLVTLSRFAKTVSFDSQAQAAFNVILNDVVPAANITTLDINHTDADIKRINTTLTMPEESAFYTEDQEEISRRLTDELGTDLELQFTVVRTSSISSSFNEPSTVPAEQEISTIIQNLVRNQFVELDLVNVDVFASSQDNETVYVVKAAVAAVDLTKIEALEDALNTQLSEKPYNTSISFTPLLGVAIEEPQEPSVKQLHQQYVTNQMRQLIRRFLQESESLTNIEVVISDTSENPEEFTVEDVAEYYISAEVSSNRTNPNELVDSITGGVTDIVSWPFVLQVKVSPFTLITTTGPKTIDMVQIEEAEDVPDEDVIGESN